MSLITDIKLTRDRETASALLTAVAELEAQKVAVKESINVAKAQIRIDVPLDAWDRPLLKALGRDLEILKAINQKLGSIKLQLPDFKNLVDNIAYETEIQDVIDTL